MVPGKTMPQGHIGMWPIQCITNWIVEHVAHASSCVAGHVHIIEGILDARRIRTLSSVEHECRYARHQSVRTGTRQTGPPLRWYVFFWRADDAHLLPPSLSGEAR